MTQSVPPITQNFGRPSWRPDAQSGLDPDMRRMAVIAAAMGGAVALVVGAISLSHRVHHGVPVIEPMAGPVRVKPLDPGGMKVAGAEDAVSGVEALGPAAEKPALHALRARIKPVVVPAAKPAVVPAAKPAVLPAAKPAVVAEARGPAIPPILAVPRPQKASLLQPMNLPVPAPVPLSTPSANTVQLAALESEQAARAGWEKIIAKNPPLFIGRKPEIERAEVAGRVVYRLRTGGFANIAGATQFCSKLRASGGECSIAAF